MKFVDKMRILYRLYKKKYTSSSYQKKQLLQSIDKQLKKLHQQLETNVSNAATGKSGLPQRSIEYTIQDQHGQVLQTAWHDVDHIDLAGIKSLTSYKQLLDQVKELGLNFKLSEQHCDEYDDEPRFSYIVKISGW